jgi:folate-binding protein YgfZ
MTEVLKQPTIEKSPLDENHVKLGAIMTDREGWSVPSSYGDESSEYAAIREKGAGVIDLSSRGRLLVSGSEAIPFLNGLITNDMKTLEENHWMPAAFPNVQGRLLASVRVVRLKDDTTGKSPRPAFLIDTERITHETVSSMLKRFTLAGDFHVTDLNTETVLLSLQGKEAPRIVREVLGDAANLGHFHAAQVAWLNKLITVVRASHTSEEGFDFLLDVQNARHLFDAFLKAGARPVGFKAFELLRIEAGQPRYGIDMNETNVVSETNLDDAISFTKGCYIGQEIIARIKYRGHVAKKLTGIKFPGAVRIESGNKILSQEGKEIGRLTSVTFSPYLTQTIALAYVKYDYLTAASQVKVVAGDDQFSGVVSELPFVRGSWYEN